MINGDEKELLDNYNKVFIINNNWANSFESQIDDIKEFNPDFNDDILKEIVTEINKQLLIEKYSKEKLRFKIRLPEHDGRLQGRVRLCNDRILYTPYRSSRDDKPDPIENELFIEIDPYYHNLLEQLYDMQQKAKTQFLNHWIDGSGLIRDSFKTVEFCNEPGNIYYKKLTIPKMQYSYFGGHTKNVDTITTNVDFNGGFKIHIENDAPIYIFEDCRTAVREMINVCNLVIKEMTDHNNELVGQMVKVIQKTKYWDYYLMSKL